MRSKLSQWNARTLVRTSCSVLCTRSCLCVCFATMKLLLNVSLVILQRFTIIARFISFNSPSFATNILGISISFSDEYFFLCHHFGTSYDPYQQLSIFPARPFRYQLRSISTIISPTIILSLLVVHQLRKALHEAVRLECDGRGQRLESQA